MRVYSPVLARKKSKNTENSWKEHIFLTLCNCTWYTFWLNSIELVVKFYILGFYQPIFSWFLYQIMIGFGLAAAAQRSVARSPFLYTKSIWEVNNKTLYKTFVHIYVCKDKIGVMSIEFSWAIS